MSRDSSIISIDMRTEQIYQNLCQANPEVPRLIEDLGLVNPETGLGYQAQEVSVEVRNRLSSIAQRLLRRGRVYSCEQVLSLFEEGLSIPRQRAVKGVSLMLSSGVLTTYSGRGIRLSM